MNTMLESKPYRNYLKAIRHENTKLNKLYSFAIAFLPVLASYATILPGFSVADVILVIFFGIAILGKFENKNCSMPIWGLGIGAYLIIVFSLFACLLGYPAKVSDVFVRTVRYLFYIAVALFVSKKLLDLEFLKKTIQAISVLATVYILLQALLYYIFGFVLKGFLPFLPLYTEQYAAYDYAAAYETLRMYRPTSFFLEPAHYARYAILGISLFLFSGKRVQIKQLLLAFFCAIGILISTSSQGYLLLAVVFLGFLVLRIRKIKSNTSKSFAYIAILLLPVVLYLLSQIPFVSSTIDRSLAGDITKNTSAVGARLGGFLAFQKLPWNNILFGTGFGNVPENVWCSSAAYWLYGAGVFVFLLYFVYLLYLIFSAKGVAKLIALIFLLLFFSDDSFYSYLCVIFYSLILYYPKLGEKDECIAAGDGA